MMNNVTKDLLKFLIYDLGLLRPKDSIGTGFYGSEGELDWDMSRLCPTVSQCLKGVGSNDK